MHSSTDLFHKIRFKWFPGVEIGHFDIHLLVPPIEVLLIGQQKWHEIKLQINYTIKAASLRSN